MNTSGRAPDVAGLDVPGAKVTLRQKLVHDHPAYVPMFREAFGKDLVTASLDEVWTMTGRALGAFVTQTAVSRNAAFDRWNAGDDAAMSESTVRGVEVFRGSGKCISCHSGPLFTDFRCHNVSTSPPRADGTRTDEGRYNVTSRDEDRGQFLTPSLRQVTLSDRDVDDLVAFLRALRGETLSVPTPPLLPP